MLQQKNQIKQIKKIMDIKQQRRNNYFSCKNKSEKFASNKQKLKKIKQQSEQFTHLIQQVIPNSSVFDLINLMDKKYCKIVRSCPLLQKQLNKSLAMKINAIPSQLREKQLKKIFDILLLKIDDFKISKYSPSFPNHFKITKSGVLWMSRQILGAQDIEGSSFNYSKYLEIQILKQQNREGKKIIKILSHKKSNQKQFNLVATDQIIGLQIDNSKTNFEREAKNILKTLENFLIKVQKIEKINC